MSNIIQLIPAGDGPRVDSRAIAEHLGTDHRSSFRLITRYVEGFKQLGLLRFEIAKPLEGSVGGRPQSYAQLNEDQCYFLLSLSRNTQRVVDLKVRLVQAFGDARRAGTVESLSVWYQLQAVQVEEKNSAAKGSYGSRLMNNRKREKAGLQRELARLEAQVVIPLFPTEAVA
ncbi:Rha family transcriptional regulator [Bacillus velezensis]|uniref:Rha family transcriptional regulator n=1 Tax=Kitasatospora sp. NPDC056446 TaxID=3345819 RepID=UPI0013110A53|nr:Rha family transcriptional regulator [Stenotrophomonas maltophilia]MBH1503372.1 Rha family transcriptional regulator [Stenotrophomonas maltophilia]MBH1784001.1 Rha family transcriptional regulator [Stenotrophomonas maltophilia]